MFQNVVSVPADGSHNDTPHDATNTSQLIPQNSKLTFNSFLHNIASGNKHYHYNRRISCSCVTRCLCESVLYTLSKSHVSPYQPTTWLIVGIVVLFRALCQVFFLLQIF